MNTKYPVTVNLPAKYWGVDVLALIDTQAATLERVRAVVEPFDGWITREVKKALGPAPAQAEPLRTEITQALRNQVDAQMKRAEAAEARCAELDSQCTTLRVNNRVLEADNADQIDRRRAAEARCAELDTKRQELLDGIRCWPLTTPGQAAVLKAMAEVSSDVLTYWATCPGTALSVPCKAELARRETEK